jgi:hypothetical protein
VLVDAWFNIRGVRKNLAGLFEAIRRQLESLIRVRETLSALRQH